MNKSAVATNRSLAIALGVVTLLLILLPFAISSYHLELASKMLIFALFAMSLDILLGYAGLASLGHAAFFGVAAYTFALLEVRAGAYGWVAFLAGIAAASVVGGIFGVLALRARGSYFLLITLALAQIVWGIVFGWRTMTHGDDGLNVPRLTLGPSLSLGHATPFYYFVLLVVGISAILMICIVRSPFGYALRGIRESETRMLALGYDVWRYQWAAFVLAALFAGVAGCLFVNYNRFVSPGDAHVILSAEALLMVILGGAGTLIGPAIGAVVIVFMENVVSSYTARWVTIVGVIYVLVTLFAPRGLIGLAQDVYRRWTR
jgi:branched-chain amino acid transport system permease protein